MKPAQTRSGPVAKLAIVNLCRSGGHAAKNSDCLHKPTFQMLAAANSRSCDAILQSSNAAPFAECQCQTFSNPA